MADCGTITIQEAFDASAVKVSGCTASGTFSPGASTEVTVSLSNGNNQPATVDVEIAAVDMLTRVPQTLKTVTGVSVPAGATDVQRTFTVTLPSEPGDYAIRANKVSGSVSAAAPASKPKESTPALPDGSGITGAMDRLTWG